MGKDSSFSSHFHLVVWVAAADTILLKQVLSLISSYVVPMALMSRSSSLSSPGCYHLQSLSSCVVLVSSPTCVAKPYILYLNSITCGSLADCILTSINGIPFRHMGPMTGHNTYDRTHGNNKLFMSKKSFVIYHCDRHNSRTKHTQV